MTSLKERRWEIMEVGEEFGPTRVTVDLAMVRAFAFSVDDFTPAHLQPQSDGVHRAHPALLCRDARDVIGTVYDLSSGGAGMHAKHECFFFGCPEVGKTYTISGRHTEKYIKREKQYIVLESEVRDMAGALLFRQRSTHIRGLRPGVAKATPKSSGQPIKEPEGPVARNKNEVRPGVLLAPLHKRFSQEHLTVFAGASWRNIHNDPEIAADAGLGGTIASGLQTMAAVCELMEFYFEDGWINGGHIAVAFIAPLLADEPITVGAQITELASGRAIAEVWATTSTGNRVLVGGASARI